jgi:ubiquinone/menaquinone biosynthesis C-methylase UbiE
MGLKRALVAQFRRPTGRLGALAGWIMAHRPSNRRRNAWAIELLALAPGERVLELGSGPGLALERALAGATSFALGLDHSAVMLAQAARRSAAALADGRLALREGGPEALRLDDPPFDAAMMANVAQFLPDRPAAFARIRASLKPGGRIAIVHQPRIERDKAAAADAMEATLTRDLNAAGFADIAVRRLEGQGAPVIGVTARAP